MDDRSKWITPLSRHTPPSTSQSTLLIYARRVAGRPSTRSSASRASAPATASFFFPPPPFCCCQTLTPPPFPAVTRAEGNHEKPLRRRLLRGSSGSSHTGSCSRSPRSNSGAAPPSGRPPRKAPGSSDAACVSAAYASAWASAALRRAAARVSIARRRPPHQCDRRVTCLSGLMIDDGESIDETKGSMLNIVINKQDLVRA